MTIIRKYYLYFLILIAAATVFLVLITLIYQNKLIQAPASGKMASNAEISMTTKEIIRLPAVAGGFYPGNKTELKKTIAKYLDQASTTAAAIPKIIIVPHAGYEYSGRVAAESFKALLGSGYEQAIILAPSHHFPAAGLFLSAATGWQTPLGLIKVSALNNELSHASGFKYDEAMHAPEHAIEVELPFLQTVLPEIQIVPIIVGSLSQAGQEQFVRTLDKYLDDKTLLIVSADLSHYHPAAEAAKLDDQSLSDILRLASEDILDDEIDASWAVASVLKLAQAKGWEPRLLKYANSSDVTGDRSAAVGYGAVGFYVNESGIKKPESGSDDEYAEAEKKELLQIARKTIETYLKTGKTYQPQTNNPKFLEKRGAFVTLTIGGQLRGCIGYIEPIKPLIEAVRDNAMAAAVSDDRFEPVRESELPEIKIEISILTLPQKDTIDDIAKFKKGAILRRGNNGATYLPQVWDDLSDPKVFFSTLCAKGGLPRLS
jgi:hypothetical protein